MWQRKVSNRELKKKKSINILKQLMILMSRKINQCSKKKMYFGNMKSSYQILPQISYYYTQTFPSSKTTMAGFLKWKIFLIDNHSWIQISVRNLKRNTSFQSSLSQKIPMPHTVLFHSATRDLKYKPRLLLILKLFIKKYSFQM